MKILKKNKMIIIDLENIRKWIDGDLSPPNYQSKRTLTLVRIFRIIYNLL